MSEGDEGDEGLAPRADRPPAGVGTAQLRRASDEQPAGTRGMLPLLDAVARDALDPSYAAAAYRRRREDDRSPPLPVRRRHRLAGPAALAACGVLAGVVVAGQRAQAPAAARARLGLLADAEANSGQVDALERQLTALQSDIAAQQAAALSATSTGRMLAERANRLTAATAQTPVSGPGAVVVLTDAPATARSAGAGSRPTGAGSSGRVLDREVQDAVNALWAAGAEAVAVNGQRLAPATSIRTAGEAILVDFRPVASPYVIEAIGNPNQLAVRFAGSGTAARYEAYGQLYGIGFERTGSDELQLVAAQSVELRYARPETPPPVGENK